MSLDADKAIPPQLIEDALQRISASREIVNCNRKRRFLQFIVREALAGHADWIKTCAIALEAFKRDASFVLISDPVVRVEVSRLHRSLEHYCLTEGSAGRHQITIPKGSYVPQFILRDTPSHRVHQAPGDDDRLNAERNLKPFRPKPSMIRRLW